MRIKNKKNPISGVIGGFILIIIAFIMLIWNEGNNVKNIKAVDEARKNLINISSETVVLENEGRLVATNGDLIVTDEYLYDSTFNVRSSNTVKMVRYVEMYQWKEEEHNDSDGYTTYTYKKTWSGTVIDSANFKEVGHDNPDMLPYADSEMIASNATVGAFTLSDYQKSMLPVSNLVSLSDDIYLPTGYAKKGNYITNSLNSNNPQIGDIRIYFKEADVTKVSLIAKQSGITFTDYVSESGKSINKIVSGTYSGEELITQIENENNILKWVLRFLGVLFMIIAFNGLLSTILTLVSIVPILGRHVSRVIHSICSLVGLAVSFVIIAISWLAYRPLIACALLAGVAGCITLVIFLVTKLRKNNSQQNGFSQQPINNMSYNGIPNSVNMPINNGQMNYVNQNNFSNNQAPTQINLDALNNMASGSQSSNSNSNQNNNQF